MSTSSSNETSSETDPDRIASLLLRLDTPFEIDNGMRVVYQDIKVFAAADNVATIRMTPYYFGDNHSSIKEDKVTLKPSERVVLVRPFGSTLSSKKDDPDSYTIRASAKIPGFGDLSKAVSDTSSIPTDTNGETVLEGIMNR